MGVCLMAYVEDNLVPGGVEDGMERDDEFHGAQAGAQVAGIDRAALHHIAADFPAQLQALLRRHATHILRRVDRIQQFIHGTAKILSF